MFIVKSFLKLNIKPGSAETKKPNTDIKKNVEKKEFLNICI